MTRTAQQPVRARRAAVGSAALAAGLAMVVGTAANGQAAPVPAAAGARSVPRCGVAATAPMTAARTTVGAGSEAASPTGAEAAPPTGVTGNAAQKFSYTLAPEAPIGLWSSSNVTLRTPVSKGRVRLDVTTHGFSAASLMMQRYVHKTHRWVDLDAKPVGSAHPDRGTFTFPVSVAAGPGRPAKVALRVQAIDRPGRLTVAASVDDGHGHTYRAPALNAVVDRPTTTVTGWPRGTALVRGGAAREFTLAVKNTTERSYPALNAGYFAYGQSNGRALAPKDLVLEQHVPGHGWQRVMLVPGGCDPGMSARLIPTAEAPLAPGATAVYRMRLAVAGSAPVTTVEAGVSVGTGDTSLFYRTLPFPIRAQ
ncbi:hypothetical protein [Streptomyces chattanoogensis]|uniref:DUF916 domain-containing protein n=1 Tax=Streptomyces chattanoogensis TaxID=66876 RepID=A0A0N0XQ74_9ACTN|nr:hypothetical protein [Streptomyces chattanoogensis]KPC58394.1 hypothetical protein ADL29_38760 [Streptomyces chattanoogensis]